MAVSEIPRFIPGLPRCKRYAGNIVVPVILVYKEGAIRCLRGVLDYEIHLGGKHLLTEGLPIILQNTAAALTLVSLFSMKNGSLCHYVLYVPSFSHAKRLFNVISNRLFKS